jgi:hypothetical protein
VVDQLKLPMLIYLSCADSFVHGDEKIIIRYHIAWGQRGRIGHLPRLDETSGITGEGKEGHQSPFEQSFHHQK